jgi:plastocyanin
MEKTYSRTVLIASCVIVAVIALFIGYWYRDSSVDNVELSPSPSVSVSAYRTVTPKPAVSATPKAVMHTLRYSASGLDKTSLTIRVGDGVTFVNNSYSTVWPISLNCPSLDSHRGLKNGESYSLTFSARATCNFYNSLDPQNSVFSGTIIVQ